MRIAITTPRVQAALISGILLVIGVVATVQAYVFTLMRGRSTTLVGTALSQFPVWMVWAAIAPFVLLLGRRVRIARPHVARAVGLHVVVGVGVALLHTVVLALINVATPTDWEATVAQAFLGALGSQFHFLVLIYWTILGGGYALDYYQRFRERELAASQLKAQLLAARLETLRTQLHPHFLFNTLQNITVLIEEDPALAKRTVARLGDLLRRSTDSVSVQEVPLKEELEFLGLYLDIERTRFQDRLKINCNVPSNLYDALVPSFVLQPLVENCIKHGLSRQAGAAWISVVVERDGNELLLVVENGGGGKRVTPPSKWKDGVGLRATKERLEALYDGGHSVEFSSDADTVRVSLRIPYHVQPQSA